MNVSAVPTVPEAVPTLVITGTLPMVKVAEVTGPGPARLLALTETVATPVEVGIPEINPVVALTVKPAGNPETL